MLMMRIFVCIFIAISAVIAIYQYKNANLLIAQMMGVSWGALAGAFLAPFLYALYANWVTKPAVAVSFAVGVLTETFQLLLSMKVFDVSSSAVLSFVFRNSLYSGVFAMAAGLILVPIVSFFTKKTAKTEDASAV